MCDLSKSVMKNNVWMSELSIDVANKNVAVSELSGFATLEAKNI